MPTPACLLANGLDGAGEALRILVNEEPPVLNEHGTCKPRPTSASAQRVDQANGYKPKTMLTRLGEVTFEGFCRISGQQRVRLC